MKKALRFYSIWLAQYFGIIALFVPADLLLARLFGVDGIFGAYMQLFGLLFVMIGGVCFISFTGSMAQIALGMGATRRAIIRSLLLLWVVSSAAIALLSLLSTALAELMFPAFFATEMSDGGLFLALGPIPSLCAAMLGLGAEAWAGSIRRGGWQYSLVIFLIQLVVLAGYLAMAILPRFFPGGPLPSALHAGAAALGCLGIALAALNLRRLTVQNFG